MEAREQLGSVENGSPLAEWIIELNRLRLKLEECEKVK